MDLRIVEMLGIVRLAKRCVLVPILGSNFAIILLRAVLYLCELHYIPGVFGADYFYHEHKFLSL